MATFAFRTKNSNQRGGIGVVLLVILLVIVVGAAAGSGTYFWRQHRIDELDSKITDLNSQLSQKQNPEQPTHSAPATTSAGTTYTSPKGVQIVLYTPTKGAKVTSPVGVVGKVPGNWSSEASFPIQLKDSTGKVVAQGTGQVLGDWMTTQLVPFSAKLTYTSAASGSGTLVLQKDNLSGQVSNDDAVSIPIEL